MEQATDFAVEVVESCLPVLEETEAPVACADCGTERLCTNRDHARFRFVVNHSNITEELFRQLMFRTGELARDIGTNVIGRDAVEYGLIDRVGGLADAMAELNRLIEARKAGGTVQ